MRIHHALSLALACSSLLASPLAQAKHAANEPAASNEIAPQIVHISYLDGDVRVSRGTQGGAPKNVDWEKAVNGLPLETGFSLATGEGRAEIEFEDASTVYLAPNSVLICNALVSIGDVPHTEVALLTGTATLEIQPTVPGDIFILRTPTDTLTMPYGKKIDLRVTSYMDAVAVTPLQAGFIQASTSTPLLAPAARTLYYTGGKHVDHAAPAEGVNFSDWDRWVANRYNQRSAAMATLLKQTGLKKPVPGLALLAGQGRFVDCPGYGTCWEPPAVQPQVVQNGQSAVVPVANVVGSDAHPITVSATDSTSPSVALSGSQAQRDAANSGLGAYGMFPCGPGSPYYGLSMYPGLGMGYMNAYGMGGYGSLMGVSWYGATPWAWAVCHSGSWLFQDNRYLWVPGNSIQRRLPIRWMQVGNRFGYVPIHPRDVAGAPPINRGHGIVPVGGKDGQPVQRIVLSSDKEGRTLDSAPKGFRDPLAPRLSASGAPNMEAHVLHPVSIGDKSGMPGAGGARAVGVKEGAHMAGIDHASPTSIPITFDHRSQNFMMSHPVGGGSKTVTEPVGSYIARSGGSFGGNQGNPRSADAFGGRNGLGGGDSGNRGGFMGGDNPRAGFNGGGGGFNGGGSSPSSGGMQGGGGGAAPVGGGGFHGGGGSMGGGNSGGGGGSMSGAAPSGGSPR